MVVEKYTDKLFEVNSYVIKENNHGLVVDPIAAERYADSLRGCTIDFIFITHEHYDHIAQVHDFKTVIDAKVVCGETVKNGVSDPRVNLLRYSDYLAEINYYGSDMVDTIAVEDFPIDQCLKDREEWCWQGHRLLFRSTPGHSKGGFSLFVDEELLFVGDSLFKEHSVATRLPGGNTKQYYQETLAWYESLPPETIVYPGHGESFLLKERYKCE